MLKQEWKALCCPPGQVVLPDFQGTAQRGLMVVQRGWDSHLPSKAYLSWPRKDITAEGCKTQLDHAFDPGSATTRCSVS